MTEPERARSREDALRQQHDGSYGDESAPLLEVTAALYGQDESERGPSPLARNMQRKAREQSGPMACQHCGRAVAVSDVGRLGWVHAGDGQEACPTTYARPAPAEAEGVPSDPEREQQVIDGFLAAENARLRAERDDLARKLEFVLQDRDNLAELWRKWTEQAEAERDEAREAAEHWRFHADSYLRLLAECEQVLGRASDADVAEPEQRLELSEQARDLSDRLVALMLSENVQRLDKEQP